MSIKIILADDHPIIWNGFREICSKNSQLNLINTVENGEQLITSYMELLPDVIVVDISMPVLDGVEAFKRIKKINKNVKCIFYSFYGSKLEIYKLYQLGARGYICKSRNTSEILNAIKIVNEGNYYFDSSFTQKDYSKFQNSLFNKNSRLEGRKLSKRESDILVLVSQGLTNKIIGQKLGISERTVEFHRRNIRQKFGLIGSSELVKFAITKVQ